MKVIDVDEYRAIIHVGDDTEIPKQWMELHETDGYLKSYKKLKSDTAKLYDIRRDHLVEKFQNNKNCINNLITEIHSYGNSSVLEEKTRKYELQQQLHALLAQIQEFKIDAPAIQEIDKSYLQEYDNLLYNRPKDVAINTRIQMYPHPCDLLLLSKTFQKEGLVNAAISKTAKAVMQPGYTLDLEHQDGKKYLELWQDNTDIMFHNFLYDSLIDWMTYGNMYVEPVEMDEEVIKLRQLRPEYMFLDVDALGTVYGYWQVGEYFTNYYTADEVIHWKREARGMPYGLSMIYPALDMIKRKLELWQDITKAIHRYGNPIIVVTFGNEIRPKVPKQMITDFMNDLTGIKPKSDVGLPFGISMEVLDTNKGLMDITPHLQQLKSEILAAVQCPPVVFGESAGRGGGSMGEQELEIWDKDSQTIQHLLATGLMIPLYKKVLATKRIAFTKNRIAVKWNRFNRIERDKQEQNMVKLKESGILTPNECREILGFATKISSKDPMTQEIDNSYGEFAQPRTAGGKNLGITAPPFESNKLSPTHSASGKTESKSKE